MPTLHCSPLNQHSLPRPPAGPLSFTLYLSLSLSPIQPSSSGTAGEPLYWVQTEARSKERGWKTIFFLLTATKARGKNRDGGASQEGSIFWPLVTCRQQEEGLCAYFHACFPFFTSRTLMLWPARTRSDCFFCNGRFYWSLSSLVPVAVGFCCATGEEGKYQRRSWGGEREDGVMAGINEGESRKRERNRWELGRIKGCAKGCQTWVSTGSARTWNLNWWPLKNPWSHFDDSSCTQGHL